MKRGFLQGVTRLLIHWRGGSMRLPGILDLQVLVLVFERHGGTVRNKGIKVKLTRW